MHAAGRTVRAGSAQMESLPGDKAANFKTMERLIAQASKAGVQILAFPECGVTGYWFIRNLSESALRELAEPIPSGPSTRRLLELARANRMTIGAGWIEAGEDGALFNSYVVALPDGTYRRHRKIQAFEHPLVQSGSDYTVFDTPYGFRVGVLICYDNNVIENGRISALLGADILLAPHQTGGCRTANPHLMGLVERAVWDRRREDPAAIEREFAGDKGRGWLMRWLPSRAHDNGVFLVFSNGVGVDDDEVRTGNAMILDPYGRILAETGVAADALVVADLQGDLLARATGREWIAARRPDLYGILARPTGRERDTRELKFEE